MNAAIVALIWTLIIVANGFICGVVYLLRSQREEQPLLWHQQPYLMAGLTILFGAGILAIFPVALTLRNITLMILSGLLILVWVVCLVRILVLQQRQFRAK